MWTEWYSCQVTADPYFTMKDILFVILCKLSYLQLIGVHAALLRLFEIHIMVLFDDRGHKIIKSCE